MEHDMESRLYRACMKIVTNIQVPGSLHVSGMGYPQIDLKIMLAVMRAPRP